jgi:D-3-phosphoglycerate dehydrogenase
MDGERMKYRALVTAELDVEVLKKTVPEIDFDVAGYCVDHEVMESAELAEMIAPYDILISEFETVNASVIDAADKLRLIVCCRGGVKSVVDLQEAGKRNIMVAYNAGRNASAVSEMVMGYILDLCRNITKSNQLIHDRVITSDHRDIPSEYKDTIWGLDKTSPYVALRGRSPKMMTLGIVGYGNVGRQVAEKASVFGMDIIIYDPIDASMATSENVKSVSFEELLKESDVVTLHCPLTATNRKMMSDDQFRMMKNDAFFINAARGGLVDEEALVRALKEHQIAGAAVDVVTQEPIPDNHILLDAPNLLITPHIAGASDEVVRKGTEMVIHKLINFLGMDLVM